MKMRVTPSSIQMLMRLYLSTFTEFLEEHPDIIEQLERVPFAEIEPAHRLTVLVFLCNHAAFTNPFRNLIDTHLARVDQLRKRLRQVFQNTRRRKKEREGGGRERENKDMTTMMNRKKNQGEKKKKSGTTSVTRICAPPHFYFLFLLNF